MFKANTPLTVKGFTAHFNNSHVFPTAYYSPINIYNMSSCLPNPFSDLSCYPDTSKQVVRLLYNEEERAFKQYMADSFQEPKQNQSEVLSPVNFVLTL